MQECKGLLPPFAKSELLYATIPALECHMGLTEVLLRPHRSPVSSAPASSFIPTDCGPAPHGASFLGTLTSSAHLVSIEKY